MTSSSGWSPALRASSPNPQGGRSSSSTRWPGCLSTPNEPQDPYVNRYAPHDAGRPVRHRLSARLLATATTVDPWRLSRYRKSTLARRTGRAGLRGQRRGAPGRGTWAEGPWQVSHGPFDEATFARLPERDWTLLVQAVDHYVPEVAELLECFDFLPRWRLDDIMISYAHRAAASAPMWISTMSSCCRPVVNATGSSAAACRKMPDHRRHRPAHPRTF